MTLITEDKLPNLFIPGAGKSGTSSLHQFLNTHPSISMSTIKEPHFWTNPNYDKYKLQDFETYLSLFNPEIIYRGESSTGYLFFENFIENIQKRYSKSPKFIILLRNPIDRIYSHYCWLKGIGSENLELKKAILNNKNIVPDQLQQLPEHHYKNYFQFGLYGNRVDKFYKTFGKENIHIITTEKLLSDKLNTVNSCFIFLGIKPLQTLPENNLNQTTILKFPWLYKNVKKFALGKYKIKKIAKPFFPKSIRKKLNGNIYPTIFKLTATSKKYPKATSAERTWIKQLYCQDIAILKKTTQMSFNEWKDFNDI